MSVPSLLDPAGSAARPSAERGRLRTQKSPWMRPFGCADKYKKKCALLWKSSVSASTFTADVVGLCVLLVAAVNFFVTSIWAPVRCAVLMACAQQTKGISSRPETHQDASRFRTCADRAWAPVGAFLRITVTESHSESAICAESTACVWYRGGGWE